MFNPGAGNRPHNTPPDMTYNIYIAEKIYTRKDDGNCYENCLSLRKVADGLHDFTAECWPVIAELKKNLVAAGAFEGCLSRSEEWSIDHLTRNATESDTERDAMTPDLIGIDIITTPYELTLKAA